MTAIATKFAGRNPFKPPKKPVRTAEITITSDPVQTRKDSQPSGKYKKLFAKMQPGQSLRVPTPSVNSVCQALRKYLRERGDPQIVARSVLNYKGDNGFGRVWMLEAE
jgi:hypothetical protein